MYWLWGEERSYNRLSKIPQKEWQRWFGWKFELFIKEVYCQSKNKGILVSFLVSGNDWWIHFLKVVQNSINNKKQFLRVECFKFAFFSLWLKRNWRMSKTIRAAIIFIYHFNLPMKTGLLVDRICITLLRKILVIISMSLTMMTFF